MIHALGTPIIQNGTGGDEMERTNYNRLFEGSKEEQNIKTKKRTKTGVVNCKRLNLRKKPSKESKIVTVLNEGEPVVILYKRSDEWYHINDPNGQYGFVMAQFVSEIGEEGE